MSAKDDNGRPTMKRILLTCATALAAATLSAADFHIRAVRVTPLDAPDQQEVSAAGRISPLGFGAVNPLFTLASASDYLNMPRLAAFPVAGTVGRELYVPAFVDLDTDPGTFRDYNCGKRSFDEHDGTDIYARSFREQEIGVPVFAALDGVVTAVSNEEPDMNTTNPDVDPNFINIDHGNGLTTQYVHLKRHSAQVQVGDRVVAGQQIALIGSSGKSTAPHIHFGVRYNGRIVEPMAGPCRPGVSGYLFQPPAAPAPQLIGAAVSTASFANSPVPYDNTPRSSTFYVGRQAVYVKLDVSNLEPSSVYSMVLKAPNGAVTLASTDVSNNVRASLYTLDFDLDADLQVPGTWTISVDVAGKRLADLPITVLNGGFPIANRAPFPVSASIEPLGLRPGEVPVCRVSTSSPYADPDYDVVSYNYTWTIDGAPVRTVTTAAQSDSIARNLLAPGKRVSCSVTVSDGKAQTSPATANATVQTGRTRAAGR